jgi:hypothetical protein
MGGVVIGPPCPDKVPGDNRKVAEASRRRRVPRAPGLTVYLELAL